MPGSLAVSVGRWRAWSTAFDSSVLSRGIVAVGPTWGRLTHTRAGETLCFSRCHDAERKSLVEEWHKNTNASEHSKTRNQ